MPDSARTRRAFLATEFTVLFIAVPIGMYMYRLFFARLVIPTILVAALGCLLYLLRDRDFNRRSLWNTDGFVRGIGRIMIRFMPLAIIVSVVFAFRREDLWLNLPRNNRDLWVMIMVLYPLLSVYPQEIIFRTFIFQRYRSLFTTPSLICGASAVAFGMAHLFFANPIAPIMSGIGGWMFAQTYLQSRSTLQSVIEHGLWGDLVFTIGLGWYFWGGSVS